MRKIFSKAKNWLAATWLGQKLGMVSRANDATCVVVTRAGSAAFNMYSFMKEMGHDPHDPLTIFFVTLSVLMAAKTNEVTRAHNLWRKAQKGAMKINTEASWKSPGEGEAATAMYFFMQFWLYWYLLGSASSAVLSVNSLVSLFWPTYKMKCGESDNKLGVDIILFLIAAQFGRTNVRSYLGRNLPMARKYYLNLFIKHRLFTADGALFDDEINLMDGQGNPLMWEGERVSAEDGFLVVGEAKAYPQFSPDPNDRIFSSDTRTELMVIKGKLYKKTGDDKESKTEARLFEGNEKLEYEDGERVTVKIAGKEFPLNAENGVPVLSGTRKKLYHYPHSNIHATTGAPLFLKNGWNELNVKRKMLIFGGLALNTVQVWFGNINLVNSLAENMICHMLQTEPTRPPIYVTQAISAMGCMANLLTNFLIAAGAYHSKQEGLRIQAIYDEKIRWLKTRSTTAESTSTSVAVAVATPHRRKPNVFPYTCNEKLLNVVFFGNAMTVGAGVYAAFLSLPHTMFGNESVKHHPAMMLGAALAAIVGAINQYPIDLDGKEVEKQDRIRIWEEKQEKEAAQNRQELNKDLKSDQISSSSSSTFSPRLFPSAIEMVDSGKGLGLAPSTLTPDDKNKTAVSTLITQSLYNPRISTRTSRTQKTAELIHGPADAEVNSYGIHAPPIRISRKNNVSGEQTPPPISLRIA